MKSIQLPTYFLISICLIIFSCRNVKGMEYNFLKFNQFNESSNAQLTIDTFSIIYNKKSFNWNSFFSGIKNREENDKCMPYHEINLSKDVTEYFFYFKDSQYYVYFYKDFGPIFIVESNSEIAKYKLISHPKCSDKQLGSMIRECDSLFSSIGGIPNVKVPKVDKN